MKKIVFSNLLLLVLLLALVLVIWIDPFSERDPAPVLLTDVATGTIKTISLRQSSELHFSMEKRTTIKGDFWWLTAPIKIPADKEKVKQILDLLHTNSLRRYQIKSANLVKLGLDPPSWEIALDQVLVKFGKTEPIEQRRYVLVGATVHLINDRFSQYNFGSPLMLANLDILPVDKSVTEIHLPDKVIKKVDGQWQSSPSSEAISQNSLNEFIDEWRYAQALRVALADNQEQTANATPITIYLEKAEQPIHLTVEPSDNDFVITNKDWGVRYYVNSSIGERLLHVSPPAHD